MRSSRPLLQPSGESSPKYHPDQARCEAAVTVPSPFNLAYAFLAIFTVTRGLHQTAAIGCIMDGCR